MARLGRKKIIIPFDTSPDLLQKIEAIKKKVKIKMVMQMHRKDSLEIDVRGSKEDVQSAIERIKTIMKS
ncbi:MAG: hypothetical protein ACTSUE_08925 [Promethearchaeota archaeon]